MELFEGTYDLADVVALLKLLWGSKRQQEDNNPV